LCVCVCVCVCFSSAVLIEHNHEQFEGSNWFTSQFPLAELRLRDTTVGVHVSECKAFIESRYFQCRGGLTGLYKLCIYHFTILYIRVCVRVCPSHCSPLAVHIEVHHGDLEQASLLVLRGNPHASVHSHSARTYENTRTQKKMDNYGKITRKHRAVCAGRDVTLTPLGVRFIQGYGRHLWHTLLRSGNSKVSVFLRR